MKKIGIACLVGGGMFLVMLMAAAFWLIASICGVVDWVRKPRRRAAPVSAPLALPKPSAPAVSQTAEIINFPSKVHRRQRPAVPERTGEVVFLAAVRQNRRFRKAAITPANVGW